jgi:hypothetical protein
MVTLSHFLCGPVALNLASPVGKQRYNLNQIIVRPTAAFCLIQTMMMYHVYFLSLHQSIILKRFALASGCSIGGDECKSVLDWHFKCCTVNY